MKRSFITLYAPAVMTLTAVAQPRFTPNTEAYGFEQIEWRHPVAVQCSITNTGNQPLVLTDVKPDCTCSVARWTKTPIAPRAKGVVDVIFDAEVLGHFNKSVAIYSNAQLHLVYLKFDGGMMREIKDFTKTHPHLIGQMRIDKNSLDFPDVQASEKPVMYIGVVNLSDRLYEPVLMHLSSYLQTEAKSNILQKDEKGAITITPDSERLTDFGLTQTSVYLARFPGGEVGGENEVPVPAALLPDFSGMTETEKMNVPVANLSTKDIDMSVVLARKPEAYQDIIITNTKRSPLRISKPQVFHPVAGVGLKRGVSQPGESTRLRATVVKRNIGKRRHHLCLLVITNDPMQSKAEINIRVK